MAAPITEPSRTGLGSASETGRPRVQDPRTEEQVDLDVGRRFLCMSPLEGRRSNRAGHVLPAPRHEDLALFFVEPAMRGLWAVRNDEQDDEGPKNRPCTGEEVPGGGQGDRKYWGREAGSEREARTCTSRLREILQRNQARS